MKICRLVYFFTGHSVFLSNKCCEFSSHLPVLSRSAYLLIRHRHFDNLVGKLTSHVNIRDIMFISFSPHSPDRHYLPYKVFIDAQLLSTFYEDILTYFLLLFMQINYYYYYYITKRVIINTVTRVH